MVNKKRGEILPTDVNPGLAAQSLDLLTQVVEARPAEVGRRDLATRLQYISQAVSILVFSRNTIEIIDSGQHPLFDPTGNDRLFPGYVLRWNSVTNITSPEGAPAAIKTQLMAQPDYGDGATLRTDNENAGILLPHYDLRLPTNDALATLTELDASHHPQAWRSKAAIAYDLRQSAQAILPFDARLGAPDDPIRYFIMLQNLSRQVLEAVSQPGYNE